MAVDVERLAQELTARGLTVAVGESATGGLTGYLLSSQPGASRYFLGGVTAYGNAAKTAVLSVPESAFDGGAVSAAVAEAMARGARELLRADIGIADTGIAGPGGATDTKPVGLFYVALSARGGHDVTREHRFEGGRAAVQRAAAEAALALLFAHVSALPGGAGNP